MSTTRKNTIKRTDNSQDLEYVIKKKGIEHLQRILQNGCLIDNIDLPTARKLCCLFQTIKSIRLENKTIYYLKGKEKETLQYYLQKRPEKIINYSKLKQWATLLDIKITKKTYKKHLENTSKCYQIPLTDYL